MDKQKDTELHEKWVRKIAREEALKVIKEYKDELAKHPAFKP